MLRSLATSIFVLGVNFYSQSVLAWCENHPLIESEYSESELVFTGKVTSEKKVNPSNEDFDGIYYEIEVIELFKGNAEKTVTVFSENSSGRFSMQVGESYLVFTSIQVQEYVPKTYAISNCGNSGTLSETKAALSTVQKLVHAPNKVINYAPSAPDAATQRRL